MNRVMGLIDKASQAWGARWRFFPVMGNDERRVIQEDLKQAILHGDMRAMQKALRHGADPDWSGEDAQKPLHWAAASGNLDACDLLMSCPIDRNAVTGGMQRSALICALSHGHQDLALHLIASGIDAKNPDKKGASPLHWAAKMGFLDGCKALWEKGCDPQALNDGKQTPFDLCLSSGHEEVALWFLDQGFTPRNLILFDATETPPLHESAFRGLPLVCTRLMAQGASPNARDHHGNTPLHCAILGDQVEAMVCLIESGAHVELINNKGQTPLHVAAACGLGDACSVLIAKGVDVHVVDGAGRSPKGLARDNGHAHIPHLIDVCVNASNAKDAIETMIHSATKPTWKPSP